eukprot:CAMPEP_0175471430 /NCGR_PEP_ID=MMETSP0095-20121207/73359_1 /TAXON_ID=311494 /ORGANISM="Alexandrium monilatum, Strain CCMP3105" /LENGTH=118 /DNA_ID=CAMNT_0016772889 /DNA_START=1 /DNA_END=358 /DNA_ORIENTATION=+
MNNGPESSAPMTAAAPGGSSTAVDARSSAGERAEADAREPPGAAGAELFILGEPVLHRYYTVYDWKEKRIGFGLSDTDQNRRALQRSGAQPAEGELYSFVQVTLRVTVRRVARRPALA